MNKYMLHYTEEYGSNHLSDRTSNDDQYSSEFEAKDWPDAQQTAKAMMEEKQSHDPTMRYSDVYLTGGGMHARMDEVAGEFSFQE